MTIKEQARFWLDSSVGDLEAAENNFKSGNYDWCLFIGHLSLEKALKSLYVLYNKDTPPRTHDLVKLAESSYIELTADLKKFYITVNTFNIEARYSEYKSDFHKICTKDFAHKFLLQIKDNLEWLKSLIKSKM
ncbi:MAG: HEPN domain-containing protein [Ignavibacteriae bacterium]|nr:HEPN domain-containing protein [Ignavibacteriota bacterium]